MEHNEITIQDTARRRIVLRRLKDRTQPIEFVSVNTPLELEEAGQLSCSLLSYQEGEFQCYIINLPKNLVVRPVDWRHFAYDHKKVHELIGVCVKDNVQEKVIFEVWDSDLRTYVENSLMCALHDLSSIFDVKSVQCNFEEKSIVITVEGEHKNGERVNYTFPFDAL